jgi:diguanylate cyclase (GGDEF)-like protein
MSKDATGRCDFSPYAQLIAALLPRAAGVSVFEPDGALRWTSEEVLPPRFAETIAESAVVARQSSEPGERVLLGPDEPLYLFWLRDDEGVLTAVLALTWRGAEADSRSFSYAHTMLKPVLETLRRELVLRSRVERAALPAVHADSDDNDLQVLISTADTEHCEVADAGLQQLLQRVNQHLDCELTALVVPERNLVTVIKAQGREVDTTVVARLHRHLMSLAQVGSDTLLLNDPDSLPGVELPFRVLAATLRNPAGRVAGVLALFRSPQGPAFRSRDGLLASLLARRAAGIIDSSYDALSGVLTRKAFEQRARGQLARRRDNTRAPWSCLYLDADRMHVVNDNYGMPIGDRLIAKFGELIRSRLGQGELAARISGDRFAILLPVGEEEACHFAERLRGDVEKLSVLHLGGSADASFQASVSVGVAGVNDPRIDLAHALAVAETACKAAKDRGRNRVELYQASDLSIMRRYEDINMAPTLRTALKEGRVRLDAQLIAPLPGSGATKPHYELLLRMIDDNGEAIGPSRFLSAAIRYQMMPEIDRWVIAETLRLLAPHAQLLADCPVVFTVNISGQSLVDDQFADHLIAQIRASGIAPAVLCFELTESAAIANLARAESMMKRLRALGCGIALDDFGTGLSSLAYLRALPVDMLKIDGSFVRDVLKDPRAESMVQAIAQLARSMQLTTVAEYVETDEIRLRVARLGVDYGQGFAIARPAPFADALRDLPTYALLARAGSEIVEEITIGADEDTITAELHAELHAELQASATLEEDATAGIEQHMERILAGYDHSESALYQHKAAG